MKKKILLLIVIFYSFSVFSQKSGKAIYKMYMVVDSVKSKTTTIENTINLAQKGASKLQFELVFNDTISKFSTIPFISSEDKSENYALAWCNCNVVKYTQPKKKTILFNNKVDRLGRFKKNEFLIEDKIGDWVLHNDFKIINNYKCNKATQEIFIKSKERIIKRTITAWYCPDIPINYGPNGYFNLPGFIFELQENNIVFGLESIIFTQEPDDINLPTEGEKISKEKFSSISEERIQNTLKEIETKRD